MAKGSLRDKVVFSVSQFRSDSKPSKKPYETLLYTDGSLSCNCPRWIFKRSGESRNCWHCDEVRDSIRTIYGGMREFARAKLNNFAA
jgi:hypothetical protein